MAGSVRATCPNCQNSLTIPRAWADKAFKCKNCGAVIKGIPGTDLPAELPPGLEEAGAMAGVGAAQPAVAVVAASPVEYSPPAAVPQYAAPVAAPAPYAPYPQGPGYAPPAGYPAPAPGYGYAPPPVYPASPQGYPAPVPGYPAPYSPAPAYGVPPGYPPPAYSPAASTEPYSAAPAAGMPAAPMPNPQAPRRRPPTDTGPIANAQALNLPEPTFGAGRERRPRKTSNTATFVWVGLSLILTLGLVGGGIYASGIFKKQAHPDDHSHLPPGVSNKHVGSDSGKTPSTQPGGIRSTETFPRRLLVLNVTKYLYANGLTSGKSRNGSDHVSTISKKLAFEWFIPDDFKAPNDPARSQTFMVSDSSSNSRPMFKDTLAKSYESFFKTSRKQDRIVIYYGGHAVEKDGKAYLVPVDGELDNLETLLPLDDFWEKLQACPAQQKVVFFDVCRLNEDGDKIRPGSEEMSEGLEKALHTPPPGVQVVSSCSAKQLANEFRRSPSDAPEAAGSLFLSAFKYVADKGKAKPPKPQTANDPIPVAQWVIEVGKRVTEVANFTTGRPQTVKFTDSPDVGTLAHNVAEPPAARFDLPITPAGMSVEAVSKLTKAIELPPIRPSTGGLGDEDPIAKVVPFNPDLMKDYTFDGQTDDDVLKNEEKFPVRAATVEAIKYINAHWGTGEEQLRTHFLGNTDDGVKAAVTKEQELPAIITEELKDIRKKMDKALEKLDKEESKYWKVTFLYSFAQIKSRMAFMEEYNFALAAIKTEALPERKKGEPGYQLVSTLNPKGKVKELAEESKELFTQIESEHKGTPWAIQAKRAKVVSLGLKWVPYAPGSKEGSD